MIINIDLSPYRNKYMLVFEEDFIKNFKGMRTFALIPSRILGISYPDYLRFASSLGGVVIGKTGYPVVYFDKKEDAEKLQKIVINYWNKGIKKFD